MCHFIGTVREMGQSERAGLVDFSSLSAITPNNIKWAFGQLESVY